MSPHANVCNPLVGQSLVLLFFLCFGQKQNKSCPSFKHPTENLRAMTGKANKARFDPDVCWVSKTETEFSARCGTSVFSMYQYVINNSIEGVLVDNPIPFKASACCVSITIPAFSYFPRRRCVFLFVRFVCFMFVFLLCRRNLKQHAGGRADCPRCHEEEQENDAPS